MRNQNAAHIDFFQFKGLIETNPKATPCDIDMVFERKCKFFVGEWKREGESISQGQGLLLRNLARQPQFTVVIIQGNTDGETVVEKFEQLCSDGRFQGATPKARKIWATSLDLPAFFSHLHLLCRRLVGLLGCWRN
jgi:hypothetical protein